MTETPAEENDRLLAPYIAARNQAAHECLAAMLDGRHEDAGHLLQEYQLARFAVESAATITEWFDRAAPSWPDEIRVDQASAGAAPDEEKQE